MMFRDYKDGDMVGLAICLDKYWKDVHGEDLNKTMQAEQYEVNGLEAKIYEYIHVYRANIRVLEDEGKIVGFTIYHIAFECIMIILGVYLDAEYRSKGLLKKMVFSVPHEIKKIFSQTYPHKAHEDVPRKKIYEKDGLITWENFW